MTKDKDLKRAVRERAAKTGERYATARSQLVRDTRNSDGLSLAFVRDQLASTLSNFWGEFRPQLEGLTDDEYLWEPVPGCPTIRRKGDGKFYADHEFPVRGVATIAQRICWIALILENRTNQHFGDKSVSEAGPVPSTAAEGIASLERAFTGWREAIATCDPAMLRRHSENTSPGAIDGLFPFVSVIEFMFQLLVQCASHVSMTRALYASRGGSSS